MTTERTRTPPPLARLLDRRRAARLLDAFCALAPGGTLSLTDVQGRTVAAAGSDRGDPPTGQAEIHLQGAVVGWVRAAGPVPREVLRALAQAVEAVLEEITDRREVALEALERYRELALMYRLSSTIGAALDPPAIADQLLAEALRATRADAAAVVSPPTSPLPAGRRGDPAASQALAGGEELLPEVLAADRTMIASRDGASLIITPLHYDEPTGPEAALILVRLADRPEFAAPDERVVLALANHADAALERARFVRHETERDRLAQELALGRRIQRSLLPQTPPDVPGWAFATRYEAASQVGGDFYDIFRLRDRPNQFSVIIADVTGKGIAAALLMAFARPLLRAIADQYAAPAAALQQANRVLVQERPTPLFITVFMGIVDAPSGYLRYAIAGHEPPLVASMSGTRVRRLAGSGPLLGVFAELVLAEHATTLQPGDLLLLHTDGAIDARDPAGRRFGDVRLARAVGAARGTTAANLVDSVAAAVARFVDGAPAADDLALLGVQRLVG